MYIARRCPRQPRSGIIAVVSLRPARRLIVRHEFQRAFSPRRLGILAIPYRYTPAYRRRHWSPSATAMSSPWHSSRRHHGICGSMRPAHWSALSVPRLAAVFYDKFGAVKPILIPIGIAILAQCLCCSRCSRRFYFIFGLFHRQCECDATSGLSEVLPSPPDGNAIFNTCLQFGGAAGTALSRLSGGSGRCRRRRHR